MEFSICVFLNMYFDLIFGYLLDWVEDDNYYVCCFVSEGMCLWLLWGVGIKLLFEMGFVFLDWFYVDLMWYVIWFVVNYLNDILKKEFDLVVDCL